MGELTGAKSSFAALENPEMSAELFRSEQTITKALPAQIIRAESAFSLERGRTAVAGHTPYNGRVVQKMQGDVWNNRLCRIDIGCPCDRQRFLLRLFLPQCSACQCCGRKHMLMIILQTA